MKELQGIFDVWFDDTKQWLYTVRDDVKGPDIPSRCEAMCKQLSRQFNDAPTRVRIEDWNYPVGDWDGYQLTFYPTENA